MLESVPEVLSNTVNNVLIRITLDYTIGWVRTRIRQKVH